jgi:hypothetical protein
MCGSANSYAQLRREVHDTAYRDLALATGWRKPLRNKLIAIV